MKRTLFITILAAGLMMPGLPALQETRFTDNLDGTVTDNATGLMWQQEDDNVGRHWETALAYCEDLVLPPSGYSDWRLPNVKELLSIVNNNRFLPAIDTTAFPGTNATAYWSSSNYAYDAYYAWLVDFWDGFVETGNYKERGAYYVRCVR